MKKILCPFCEWHYLETEEEKKEELCHECLKLCLEESKQAMQDIKEETAREVQAEKITNNNI